MSIIIDGQEYYGIIYKITNTINNHCYIGQTTNKRGFRGRYDSAGNGIERVYNFYKREKKGNRHYNKHLFSAIEKYGFEAFNVCEIFDTAKSKDELNEKEIYYIALFDSYHNGYNMTPGGECGSCAPQLKGKDNPLSVAVCQLTLDGELVKIWDSLADIRRSGQYDVSSVEMACNGINSHAYKYLWVFQKDYDPNKEYKWKPSKIYHAVVLLDEYNNIIKEFHSVICAAKELNISRQTVTSTCRGKWEHPQYNLRYKSEYMEEQRLSVGELCEAS